MIFTSNKGKPFTKEEAIDLMVSLSATDANSEKKWRGFHLSFNEFLALRKGPCCISDLESPSFSVDRTNTGKELFCFCFSNPINKDKNRKLFLISNQR